MQGRQFAPEKIYHGNRMESTAGFKADFTRGATENPVVNAVSIELKLKSHKIYNLKVSD